MDMSSIGFCVDHFQVFKRFVFVQGWAFSSNPKRHVDIRLVVDGVELEGVVDRSSRPDVVHSHPGISAECGFALRAILPAGADAASAILRLRSGKGDEISVERPWAAAVAQAYSPLQSINERFFSAVRAADEPRVLEIGARARSGITRRQLFGDSALYTGLDIKEGENVDVVGDAHLISTYFPASSFDFAYSVSVFEHIMWPWKVAIELGKVMKVGGQILMQSHPVWPKHEVPWDFFRFWDSGWRALFCRETGFEVIETVEAHPVDLVAAPFTGSPVHQWEGTAASLASSVLARKIGEPQVEWLAVPNLESFGLYPG
jgi:SAM-dependent methyltransferase